MPSESDIIQIVASLVGQALPGLVADQLDAAAEQTDDPIAEALGGIMASYVRENGTDNVEHLAAGLADYVSGQSDNPSAIFTLGLSATELTKLTNALQDAEAEQRAKSARQVAKLGTMLGSMLGLLVKSALKAVG